MEETINVTKETLDNSGVTDICGGIESADRLWITIYDTFIDLYGRWNGEHDLIKQIDKTNPSYRLLRREVGV